MVITLAGDGTKGHRDGEALQAQVTQLRDIVYNPIDDSILMIDNHTRVRKYKDGVVSLQLWLAMEMWDTEMDLLYKLSLLRYKGWESCPMGTS